MLISQEMFHAARIHTKHFGETHWTVIVYEKASQGDTTFIESN